MSKAEYPTRKTAKKQLDYENGKLLDKVKTRNSRVYSEYQKLYPPKTCNIVF